MLARLSLASDGLRIRRTLGVQAGSKSRLNGAPGGIRTLTDFQDPPDFKSGAAADYATEAKTQTKTENNLMLTYVSVKLVCEVLNG